MVLARLIFGGGHHGGRWGHHNHWRRELHDKWHNMSPEEREKFVSHMHAHEGSCGCSTETGKNTEG